MASAEQDIGDFQADVYQRIAQAEYNAEHAENESVRQGWLDLAQQIAYTAAELGTGSTDTDREAEEQALFAGRKYIDELTGTNQDVRNLDLSIPERTTGERLPTTAPVGADGSGSPPVVDIDPIRIESPLGIRDPYDPLPIGDIDPRTGAAGGETALALPSARIESPSVKELNELFDDDSRTMLGTMMPGYEKDIAEIDELLEEEDDFWRGPFGADGPPQPLELPEMVVTAPRATRELPPDPLATVSPEEQRNMLDETQIRARMNPPATAEEPFEMDEVDATAPSEDAYKPITDTFGISEDVVPPESYTGLPSYYPLILETERFEFNSADPSKAGVWQVSYDDFLNSVEGSSSYPRDVRDLSNADIRDFYQWYHERTVADIDNEYTPESVKTLFSNNLAFQYIYSDAAVHHGHAGAAHIANQFAVLYSAGDDPVTMINMFSAQRKAYMRVLRKNQFAVVNRSYRQGDISLRARDRKVNAINRKWASLNKRAFRTSTRAKRILDMRRS